MVICNLLKYPCLKCGSETILEIRANMQEHTLSLWRSMFDGKLCFDCHDEKKQKPFLLN